MKRGIWHELRMLAVVALLLGFPVALVFIQASQQGGR